jgi:hypothetical protein
MLAMRFFITIAAIIAATPYAFAQSSTTTEAKPSSKFSLVTIEYYYRIKWGQHAEFKRLYKKNHEPVLKEMQKLGFITAMKMEEPFTHLAGDVRWDLRVTLTYRDGTTAVGDEPGGYYETSQSILSRLYPDKKAHEAEEARRMGMLEEHWDVIVYPVED